MDTLALPERTSALRRFNRFYTRQIGVLEDGLLRSPFSLTEARVLYELARRAAPGASAIARDLALDPGYLSRILARFEARGLISRTTSADDGRQSHLALTESGRAAFTPLDQAANAAVGTILASLSEAGQRQLVGAMATIRTLLGDPDDPEPPVIFRAPRAGDYGWVVHRQGALYAAEYGWDQTFEALAADIVAAFVRNFDARRDACWVAERRGETVGSIFLVRDSDQVGKLRLLYVEPEARGLGIGRRLVAECIAGARRAGYTRLTLWTNDVLVAARRIYQSAGFHLVQEERHHSFGQDLVGQFWELTL